MPAQLHHFVPRFHLRQFVDSTQERELIWVYERSKEKPELRSLDHVAAQKDYYAVKAGDGKKLQTVEEILSRVEGLAAPVIRRFLEGDRRVSADDRMTFSVFLSFGTMRTPKFREAVEGLVKDSIESYSKELASDAAKFAESVKSAEHALGENLGDPEELRDAILGEHIKIKANPEYSLKVMLEDVFGHARMINNMVWSFRDADHDTTLITSDTPVVLNNPSMLEGNGPQTPLDLEIVFPISPMLLFVATWNGQAGTGQMSGYLTRQMNKLMSLAAEKYVYSSMEIPAIAKYLEQPRKGLISEFVKAELKRSISP
jgi:Protein of unknown function (DUF4238)